MAVDIKIRLMCTAEKLDQTRHTAVDQGHAPPTPKPPMQFCKFRGIVRSIRAVDKCLCDGRLAMASCFEEDRISSEIFGLLHNGDFFDWLSGFNVTLDGHKTVDGSKFITDTEIGQPIYLGAHPQSFIRYDNF